MPHRPRPLLARALSLLGVCLLGAGLLAGCGDEAALPTEPTSDTGARAREVYEGFYHPDPERIPSQLATNPGKPWGDFTGSQACQRCHEDEYKRWRGSFHSRTLYDAVAATVFGDFSGDVIFDEADRAFIVKPYSEVDPQSGRRRFYLRIRYRTAAEGGSGSYTDPDTYGAGQLPDLTNPVFEVLHAFGNRRHQPYVVRDGAGQHWVAPVYWNDVDKQWSYDGWRPYVRSCANCHVTGIRTSDRAWFAGQQAVAETYPPRFNLPPAEEQWAEGSVGCEVCHGAGRKHIHAVEAVGVARYRAMRAKGEKGPSIYDGRSAPMDQRLDGCGQCHNFITESQCTWGPTPEGYPRNAHFKGLEPPAFSLAGHGADAGSFYRDGSHRSPCTAITVFKKTRMYEEGVGCWDCHDPHGTDHWADLRRPTANNELCLECHMDLESSEAQTAHSHHEAASPGNLCVECHMPRILQFSNGVERMSDLIHSHEFSVPTGKRRPGGPPSACHICHDDRTHRWIQEVLETWKNEAAAPAIK